MQGQTCSLSRSQKRFVKSLLKYVVGSKIVLDAGCGSGWLGASLKECLPLTVISVDIRKPIAEYRVDSFVVMDIQQIGLTKAFDLIIAKDVVEHVVYPRKALQQFHSVLKTNGKIIIDVPSPSAPYLWDDYEHVRPYTKESMTKLLLDSGFRPIYMRYLAAPTPGATLLRFKGLIDKLADKGLRRGDLIAVAKKQPD